jgi:hypothetical protein
MTPRTVYVPLETGNARPPVDFSRNYDGMVLVRRQRGFIRMACGQLLVTGDHRYHARHRLRRYDFDSYGANGQGQSNCFGRSEALMFPSCLMNWKSLRKEERRQPQRHCDQLFQPQRPFEFFDHQRLPTAAA